MQDILKRMASNPVITAVNSEESLCTCLTQESSEVVFVLYGNVCTIEDIVYRLKKAGKTVIVHMDLVAGLSGRDVAAKFIHEMTQADGVLTTKPSMIAEARRYGLYTILRGFLLDSRAFQKLSEEVQATKPDSVEILPGLVPKMIRRIRSETGSPVIAGGLIGCQADISAALRAGAIAVSTTNVSLWKSGRQYTE